MQTVDHVAEAGSAKLDRAILSCRIICLAFAMSELGFILVGTVVAQSTAASTELGLVAPVAVSVAFGALIASVMFRRLGFAPLRLETVYAAKGEDGFVQHLFTTTIVSVALAEVVGLAGLTVGVLTGDTRTMNIFCVVALVAIIVSLPRANGWREAYQQIVSRGRAGSAGHSAGRG